MKRKRRVNVFHVLGGLTAVMASQQAALGHHAEVMLDRPWLQGLSMPLHGLDHLLVTLGVGLIAAQLGGRALWMAPAGFAAVLLAGGLLNLAGVAVPLLEQMILASLILAGAQLSLRHRFPAAAVVAVFSLLGAFHGQALIQPLLAGDSAFSALAFVAGCLVSSLLLLLAGLALGRALGRWRGPVNPFSYAGATLLMGSLLIVLAPGANGWLVGILEGLVG